MDELKKIRTQISQITNTINRLQSEKREAEWAAKQKAAEPFDAQIAEQNKELWALKEKAAAFAPVAVGDIVLLSSKRKTLWQVVRVVDDNEFIVYNYKKNGEQGEKQERVCGTYSYEIVRRASEPAPTSKLDEKVISDALRPSGVREYSPNSYSYSTSGGFRVMPQGAGFDISIVPATYKNEETPTEKVQLGALQNALTKAGIKNEAVVRETPGWGIGKPDLHNVIFVPRYNYEIEVKA
jgi:hypothetical protein